jgi:TonB family protein
MIFRVIPAIAVALSTPQLVAQNSAPASPGKEPMASHTTPGKLVTMAEWNERMHRILAKELHYPSPIMGLRPGSGTVSVKFNCSDSGRPDKVSLLKTSGDTLLDRAALNAVRRMASLHPLPTGFQPSQKFVALVVFANDPNDPALNSLTAEQVKRNAWYHDPVNAPEALLKKPSAEPQLAAIR